MINSEINTAKLNEIYSSGIMNLDETDFQVLRYENTNIKIFPIRREHSYSELRVSPKFLYNSVEEFIVGSVVEEEFPAEANVSVSFRCIEPLSCDNAELEVYYSELHKNISSLPAISEVVSSSLLKRDSEFNWLFIEDETKYYSVFWKNTETRSLRLSA